MTRLGAEIRALIVEGGPISVERFIELALGHPQFGYYRTRDPLGHAGDFVTAPEISQMFGEFLGGWSAAMWSRMGAPDPVRLVELGPGRGTLMADALRAAAGLPAFRAAIDLHFVETSPVLREAQARAMERCGVTASWHETVETLPAGPVIVLANEFFDALPVRHYVKTPEGWCERVVGLSDGELAFGAAPDPEPSLVLDAPPGTLLEIGIAARRIASSLARRIVAQGGAVLAVDYGYGTARFGESLQAVKQHRHVDALAEPGEADLTTHVDFSALGRAARAAGAEVHGPVPQGEWLLRLGLDARADALKRGATGHQAASIDAAAARLTDRGTAARPGMGTLFKVMAFTAGGIGTPPGFGPGETA